MVGIMKNKNLIPFSIFAYIALAILNIGYIKSMPVYNYTILDFEVDNIILILADIFIFQYLEYLEKQIKIENKVTLIGRICFLLILFVGFIYDVNM